MRIRRMRRRLRSRRIPSLMPIQPPTQALCPGAILVIRGLVAHGRGVGGIAVPHGGRLRVRGEGVGVLLRRAAKLGVARGARAALPELAPGRAGRVAVVGRGPEGLLAPAVADERELERDGEEEEDAAGGVSWGRVVGGMGGGDVRSNDGDGEARRVEPTRGVQRRQPHERPVRRAGDRVLGVDVAVPERGVDEPRARSSSAGRERHVRKRAGEAQVQQHRERREEPEAAQAAHEQDGEDGVQHAGAGDALDGFDVGCNVDVVAGEHGEEVREDAEDDGRAAELDDSQEPGDAFECDAAECHGEDGVTIVVCRCVIAVGVCGCRNENWGEGIIYVGSFKVGQLNRNRYTIHHGFFFDQPCYFDFCDWFPLQLQWSIVRLGLE
jgi:hypothetical protein